ncbi:MAG: hypothetical protein JNK95_03640 [Candidatus Competibacter sp.]|nr:hypothetical protein [Candidatus Competibacter sp.]MDG4606762.1 hypothetical protein [Candidatus Contendobacter sp.]HRD50311.1 hypothetical protein [Candidatus Contendobacter sp.]
MAPLNAMVAPLHNADRTACPGASLVARIGYGVLLPVAVFISYQFTLIESTSGTGSWDGMGLFFGSLFIVPGLVLLNGWVIPLRWERRLALFLAGLILPAVVGLAEYGWLYGPSPIRAAINAAFVAPFVWVWVFAFLLCAPLGTVILRAIWRRIRRR